MSGLEELRYPVLTITAKGFVATAHDREGLEICGESALQSGYLEGLLLVDSGGRCWEVEHAEKVGSAGPMGGWRLLKSRRVRVQLKLREGEGFDLDNLKDRLCEAIDQFPAQWEAVEDTADTRARVHTAVDIPSLILMFEGQN